MPNLYVIGITTFASTGGEISNVKIALYFIIFIAFDKKDIFYLILSNKQVAYYNYDFPSFVSQTSLVFIVFKIARFSGGFVLPI